MSRAFDFDQTWAFPCRPEELWAVLEDTDRYPEWWPWLERFHADGLRTGSRAGLTVRPPLPYRLHVVVEVGHVEPARRLDAAIGGDVEGPARLELTARDRGCEVRLAWSLVVRRRVLVAAERVARPVMRWGHDQVVAAGVRQFRERALGAGPAPG